MPLPVLRSPRRPVRVPESATDPTAITSPAGAGNANPYSRRVALLKRTLPAIGVTLLLLIALWPRLAPIWERMRFAFPAIDLREARELRILNPRYGGTDRFGRPYVVTASVGHQAPDRQDLMSLEAPRADVKTHDGADVSVTGNTGVYQSQAQLLDLFGNVTLLHDGGTRFVTDTARVDIAHNGAEGNDPVEGHGPSGDIKSQGFRIYDKGDTILFTGKSDMLFKGARPNATPAEPPTLPPDVVKTAARAEAQAKPALAAAAAAKPSPAGAIHKTDAPGKSHAAGPAQPKPAAPKKKS